MATNYDTLKTYRIKYDVHCRLENNFGKEIIIKNCYSEVHAKFKLGKFCEKKYGVEFDFITFISVKEENSYQQLYNDLFDDDIWAPGNKEKRTDLFTDMLKKLKKKK